MAKLRIVLKDPDGVWDSVQDAGIDPNEIEESEFRDVFERFVEFKEYVVVELDSETGEARVLPVRESNGE